MNGVPQPNLIMMVSIWVFAYIHLGLPRELVFQLSPCPRGCFLLCPSGENSKIFAFWVFDKTRKWGLEGLWLRTKNLPRPSQRCFPTQPTPNTYKRHLRSFPNRSGWFSTLVILALRCHFMVFSPKWSSHTDINIGKCKLFINSVFATRYETN